MAVVILIMEQINLIIYLPLSMKSGNLIMIARVHHETPRWRRVRIASDIHPLCIKSKIQVSNIIEKVGGKF